MCRPVLASPRKWFQLPGATQNSQKTMATKRRSPSAGMSRRGNARRRGAAAGLPAMGDVLTQAVHRHLGGKALAGTAGACLLYVLQRPVRNQLVDGFQRGQRDLLPYHRLEAGERGGDAAGVELEPGLSFGQEIL